MNVGGYRHNYTGFYKKFIYQMSINRGRTASTYSVHASLVGILSFLLFLLVKSFEEEIQQSRDRADTVTG